MWKLILKNLWSRRRRNGWLLAELILVAILSWYIFDPVMVVTYERHLPLGYDADRLCMVSVGMLPQEAPGYEPQAADSASLMQTYLNLVDRARQHPDVEQATPVLSFVYPGAMGNGTSSFIAEGDSVAHTALFIEFLPHTHFFETYGFQSGKGSMSAAQLSDLDNGDYYIMTEDLLEGMFRTHIYRNQRCWKVNGTDTCYTAVKGTVKSCKYLSDKRPVPIVFMPLQNPDIRSSLDNMRIVVRLKEGVRMERFLHDFRPWMLRQLRIGNLYARELQSYDEINAAREFSDSTVLYRRSLSIALFFLVNLCLGVIGTFWMQTRTRREEVGVMLSYGATPHRIRLLLLGEGTALTTLATFIGCFIYLQYAFSEGLNTGSSLMEAVTPSWVDNFGLHFFFVSLMVYVILLLVVWIGIYIPAHRISSISPTEALRDE
ncbi:FtsX-like permease family protein [Phocaeicola plebeius]|jgi:putative ABC transport system permease protein|uniref:ABC transporter permease n=1 Tax=Phocaeicola plebeius TaxID=310297 RepID=UPI0026EC8991|nr:FtsX-like permease family protein [Phocaeicola plebeius]